MTAIDIPKKDHASIANTVIHAFMTMTSKADTSSMRECLVLLQLYVAPEPVTMSQVGELAGLSRAAMTSLADRLEDKAFVDRVHSRSDRRTIVLSLTKKGRRLVESSL